MKRFIVIFLLCDLVIAAWFLYDPYLAPLVERFRGGATDMEADHSSVVRKAPEPSKPKPAKPESAPAPGSSTRPTAPVSPADTPPQPASELEQALSAKYPMPEIRPLLAIVDEWRNVPANAYPAEIAAREPVPFDLVVDGRVLGSSNVAPGTPLKPVRLVGDQLTVASLANPAMSATLPVDKTDFKTRIEARYQSFVDTKRKEVETRRERARQIVAADPSKLALLTGKAQPQAAAAAPEDGSDPRFRPVKTSLGNGEVASAKLEEARTYRWNGPEQIGGTHAGTYETVTVEFEITTIFGKFPVEYKALLRNGKVHAWIDPVTEDPI
ncbi:MAG TPA: hypothetical protein PLA50_09560 [Bacteroidia bacterium]|nr:hypothetical protein [Bacteroidia bacterium]